MRLSKRNRLSREGSTKLLYEKQPGKGAIRIPTLPEFSFLILRRRSCRYRIEVAAVVSVNDELEEGRTPAQAR